MSDIDTHEIRDLYEATACIIGGCNFFNLRKLHQGYFHFVFHSSPQECEEVISRFRNGELVAPVKQVVDAIFLLKNQLNQYK
jgi:hypothetical protein